jgi:hypothetical protein
VVKQLLESAARAEVRDHAVRGLGQRRQVLFHDEPLHGEVNPQVAMHDHVPKPGEVTPWDLLIGDLDLDR